MLSKSTKFLLGVFAERGSLASTTSLPYYDEHIKQGIPKPTMSTINGLLKRGWIEEQNRGIYRITLEGKYASILFL